MSGLCGPRPSPHSCSVFLLDQNELVAKVFDGGVVEDEVRQGPTESVAVVLGVGGESPQKASWPALWTVPNFFLSTHACPCRAMRYASRLTRA